LGGELGQCAEVVTLFQNAGYAIEPTAPDSSHQNGPGERPHWSIAESLHAILGGAGLNPKFWSYAFEHYLWLYNVTVHGLQSASPYTLCTGCKPDLNLLRTFGCQIYALLPQHRSAKLLDHACTGIFLGYTDTMKNIWYYDVESGQVKTAHHVSFDESMFDLSDKLPNAHMLVSVKLDSLDLVDIAIQTPDLDVSMTQFFHLCTFSMPFDPLAAKTLFLSFWICQRLRCAYISDFHLAPTDMTLWSAR